MESAVGRESLILTSQATNKVLQGGLRAALFLCVMRATSEESQPGLYMLDSYIVRIITYLELERCH